MELRTSRLTKEGDGPPCTLAGPPTTGPCPGAWPGLRARARLVCVLPPAYDLGYCFHLFSGEYLPRRTALDNLPSRRLLERLGFALVSTEQVAFVENFSFLGGCFRLEKNLN